MIPKSDLEDLDKLQVPLPDLRVLVVTLLKDGISEVPLGQFLLMVKNLIRNDAEDRP